MSNNKQHYKHNAGDKQYYKPSAEKGPVYYNPKSRGFIYRYPKAFVGVCTGLSLLVLFSKPIYDFFFNAEVSRAIALEEYRKYKPRYSKD